MTIPLLLDPGILVPQGEPVDYSEEYWNRLMAWSLDGRVKLGADSHAFVYDEYARYGYPHAELRVYPAELAREFRRALDRLLARTVLCPTGDPGRRAIVPPYRGPQGAATALERDLGRAAAVAAGLASREENWDGRVRFVRCEPPPPREIQLLFSPDEPLDAESTQYARGWLAGRTVRVVGGQPEPRTLERVRDELGTGNVQWLPCERHKKPAIRKRWQGMTSERDVAVCITGRVGHATSQAAERLARSAGVPYLEIEKATGLPEGLVDLANKAGEANRD